MTTFLRESWQRLKSHGLARLVLLSVLVGVVAGLGALAFNLVLDFANELFLVRGAGFTMPQPGSEGGTAILKLPDHRWLLLIVPTVGGLLCGLVAHWLAPEAEGEGTDSVLASFHRGNAVIRKRIPLVKTLTSALTIGSGGSAGREGPIGQIGGGFGSVLATWLKTSDRERRVLMMAGTGAGIGAVFRSPLGAAFYAVEVLYRDIEFETSALVPGFVASLVAYSVFCGVSGKWGAMFLVPAVKFHHPLELPLYILLGIVCALLGMLYVKTLRFTHNRLFAPLALPRFVKPALGGLIVGTLGFFLPQVMGMGYGWVQLAIEGKMALGLILATLFLKMLATGLTVGSGGSGGLFAPSMAIGGLIGAAVGTVYHRLMPGVVIDPTPFVLVGMAGFFAGIAKVPVASLIMVSEMSMGYGLLVPLMLTAAVAYVLVPRSISIYTNQVNTRLDSPAHRGEYVADVLERILVREVVPRDAKLVAFQRETPFPAILDAVAESKQEMFPVLDSEGGLHGIIQFEDIRLFFAERGLPAQSVVAQDLIAANNTVVTLDEDLAAALRKLRTSGYNELPVVEAEGSRRVVGRLNRRTVTGAYYERMYQHSGR